MMLSYTFTCLLPNGVHARPASELELRTSPFTADIMLINHSKNSRADAKSVLSLISADITENDRCELQFAGDDQQQAFDVVTAFIDNEFADCDEPLPSATETDVKPLPVSLSQAQPEYLRGRPVSGGQAQGRPVVIGAVDLHRVAAQAEPQWLARYSSAELVNTCLMGGLNQLQNALLQAHTKADSLGREVLQAHMKIAGDPCFRQALQEQATGLNPLQIIADVCDQFRKPLLASSSRYLQERALDIEDICIQLAKEVAGQPIESEVTLENSSVLIAANLTPGQLLSLPRHLVKGLVLEQAGETSHTVILARSFGMPVLTGTENAAAFVADCDSVILDAEFGLLVRSPNPQTLRFYQMEEQKKERKQHLLAPFRHSKGCSKDGIELEVAANIAIASEAPAVFESGAEAIGLFRTEMLFMDRDQAPSEEEQFQAYRQVLQAAEGKRVIIRTLDIGGDKPLEYLDLPAEENPFLGYRAVRIYPQFEDLLGSQVRALLRASCEGALDIMVPMVSTLDEVKWLHEQFTSSEHQLREEGVAVGSWRLGIMAEVPSVMYLVEQIAPWIDFISIGSNDLCQYFMACDRGNEKVSELYNHFQPGFIRLIKEIVQRAKAAGLETGLCGEMAADPLALPLLLAIGLDEISMAAPKIAATRATLSQLSKAACLPLLESVISAPSADDVRQQLNDYLAQLSKQEVLAPELVMPQLPAASKAEVIKALTDNLEVYGRVSCSSDVEQDIWAREAVFSTALGFAVAIPHCKSAHVRHNSVSVAQLAEPVRWSDGDEGLVSTVIMLTVSDKDSDGSHMQIFSRLARKLMHPEFREQLAASPSGEHTVSLLQEHLIEKAA